MELELQNVPHHAKSPRKTAEEQRGAAFEEMEPTSAAKAGCVENAWMEYITTAFSAFGSASSCRRNTGGRPLSEPDALTTLPIYLRELFPAELVGVMVQGSAGQSVGTSELGVGYKFYVANNNFEGNSRRDLRDGKSWGARGQLRFPTGGALRRFDVAADVYRGQVGLTTNELVEDNVVGLEGQLEVSSFLFQAEWPEQIARATRTGYYLQPALRIDEDWLVFSRVEPAREPAHRGRTRYIGGLNYRPYPRLRSRGS